LVLEALEQVAVELDRRMKETSVKGYTLTLKVKFSDYTQLTRSLTQAVLLTDLKMIQEVAQQLFQGLELSEKSVRLIGLGIGKLASEVKPFEQLELHLRYTKSNLTIYR
jgi:DNA polymerase IV